MKNDDRDTIALVEQTVSSLKDGPDAVEGTVAAIITVESDVRYLPDTLSAVFGQRMAPRTVIIADCSPQAPASPCRADWRGIAIWVMPVSGARSFGDAVSLALEAAPIPAAVTRLWLLHDDSRPLGSRCLEHLVETSRNAPGASIIGAKHVGWDGGGLQDVGYYLTPSHRRASLVVDGEPDQEQYDDRQEVYGVSLAGALVSRPMWLQLGGTDPWFSTFGESTDLCRRAYRAGGRVMVCPRAAIAHVRARFAGLRDRDGQAREDGDSRNPYMAVRRSSDRFLLTDVSVFSWPLRWIGRLVTAIVWFVSSLASKRPWEAVCDLLSPLTMLVDMPRAAAARARALPLGSLPKAQRASLTATRRSLAQWRARVNAFEEQDDTPLLSSLARTHLRRMLARRVAWAIMLVILMLGLSAAMNGTVLRSALTGATLWSDILAPTAANWEQTWSAATAMHTYADGFGVSAPPAPFLLMLTALGLLTGGHMAQAITMLLLLAPALAALSFWALAGVATRSNPLRFSAAVAWICLALALGLYQHADLPMLTVHIFLPLSIALLMKAVGMHRIDPPDRPHPAVQLAALAAITLVPVTTAEPQLIVPFVLIFIAFLAMVRSHRAMLLLMPLPSAVALAPTLLDILAHWREGSWRQLFGDMTIPTADHSGAPGANGLAATLAGALGASLPGTGADDGSPWGWAPAIATVVALAVAVVALARPSVLRMSRMMWAIIISGTALAALSIRVAVGTDGDAVVAGSVMPGTILAAMGVLMAVLMAGGSRPASFAMLRGQEQERGTAARIVHGLVAVALLAGAGALAAPRAVTWHDGYQVSVASGQLPMAATDYLASDSGRRILALRASSVTTVQYAVMRTAVGDLIDVSPGASARSINGTVRAEDATIAHAAAQLLVSNSATAVGDLTKLGIGGIWIPDAHDDSQSTLLSHVSASNGTQTVVDNESGTYVRLVSDSADGVAIDTAGERAALASPLRRAWVVAGIILFASYLLVALPRRRDLASGGLARIGLMGKDRR